MKFFNLTLILFFSLRLFAQPNGQEKSKIGEISGQIVGSDSKKGIPYARITLVQLRDSAVVSGGLSDSIGNFKIIEIPGGVYYAKIVAFGYETKLIDSLFFGPKNPTKNLGQIVLDVDNNELGTVDIIAEQPEVITQIDKKVYSVDKQLTSQGGSVLDVLQNIPSITIDSDGNISLRGSANVTILIDGRPSTIAGSGRQGQLISIPASSVESIEIITNPSAKYDPDGMSGIINIILKKNKLGGFNGSIDLSIENGIHPDSLDTYSKFLGFNHNLSLNLSYRNKYFNVYTGYTSNWYEGYRNFTQSNETFYNNSYDSLYQFRSGTHLRQSHLFKLGSDFYLKNSNTIGFSVNANTGIEERTGNMFYYAYDSVSRYDVWQRISDDPGNKFSYDAMIFWNKKFQENEHKIDFVGQYSNGNNEDDGYYTENIYDPTNLSLIQSGSLNQYVGTVDNNAITTLQLDYYNPFSKTTLKKDSTEISRNGKIETGLKSTIRQVGQDYYQETENIPDTLYNNQFDFTEQVHAGYFIYGHEIYQGQSKLAKYKIQVGLRAETVFITSETDQNPIKYKTNYQSLYPSLHLVKPISNSSETSLSYSRRVNRPSLRALNPFSNYTDPLNLQVGNPELKPEYINSIELGYANFTKRITFTGSVYYRYLTNMIQRVRSIDSAGVATVTWSNVDIAQFIGADAMIIYKPFTWWRILISGNLSQTYINSTSGESDLNNSGFSWSANMSQSFTFKKGFSGQITGFYRSPMVLTQGRSAPMYSLDIAARKTFLNDKMYLGFKVADIFNTRQFAYYTEQPGIFESAGIFKHQSRRFMFSIGYAFGSQDPDRKKRQREGGSGGGDDMGM